MGNFKLGIVEWACPLPGPAGLKIAAELGLQGMELDFGEYEAGYPLYNPRIQDLYLEFGEKYGIEFPSIGLNALNTHGMCHDRNTVDGMIATETIKKGIETALKMKIPVAQLPSFDNGFIRTEKHFYNVCEKLKLACELSEGTDLIIAFENVLDAEKTKEMIREVNNPRVKVFFDTQNYHLFSGLNEAETLREIADDVAQIHIKDGYNNAISSAILGHGDAKFAETAEVIKETACTEWLFLENFYATLPIRNNHRDFYEIMRKDIQIAKETFGI
ncbi:MAG: sugar phosphate isomerase/epimerase [Eubacterium sp.]|nr:sugar phosphate isomerase/epimerase [Eubacterium sp.]